MKYLSAKNIFLLLLAIILIVIFNQFMSALYFPDTNWPLDKGDKIKIRSKSDIVQKFTSDRDDLSRISILFGSSNLDKGATLDLKVYDENCSELIRESSFFASGIGSDNTQDFAFSKIPNSKGKTFCLNLFFKPVVASKTTTLFIIDNSLDQNKSLSIDGQDYPNKSLSMRPAYKNNTPWGDFSELNQRMSQYKPWFLKHYYLAAIGISSIILSLILIVTLILLV
jgi:hypothetical protein